MAVNINNVFEEAGLDSPSLFTPKFKKAYPLNIGIANSLIGDKSYENLDLEKLKQWRITNEGNLKTLLGDMVVKYLSEAEDMGPEQLKKVIGAFQLLMEVERSKILAVPSPALPSGSEAAAILARRKVIYDEDDNVSERGEEIWDPDADEPPKAADVSANTPEQASTNSAITSVVSSSDLGKTIPLDNSAISEELPEVPEAPEEPQEASEPLTPEEIKQDAEPVPVAKAAQEQVVEDTLAPPPVAPPLDGAPAVEAESEVPAASAPSAPAAPAEVRIDEVHEVTMVTNQLKEILADSDTTTAKLYGVQVLHQIAALPNQHKSVDSLKALSDLNKKLLQAVNEGLISPTILKQAGTLAEIRKRIEFFHNQQEQGVALSPAEKEALFNFNESYENLSATMAEQAARLAAGAVEAVAEVSEAPAEAGELSAEPEPEAQAAEAQSTPGAREAVPHIKSAFPTTASTPRTPEPAEPVSQAIRDSGAPSIAGAPTVRASTASIPLTIGAPAPAKPAPVAIEGALKTNFETLIRGVIDNQLLSENTKVHFAQIRDKNNPVPAQYNQFIINFQRNLNPQLRSQYDALANKVGREEAAKFIIRTLNDKYSEEMAIARDYRPSPDAISREKELKALHEKGHVRKLVAGAFAERLGGLNVDASRQRRALTNDSVPNQRHLFDSHINTGQPRPAPGPRLTSTEGNELLGTANANTARLSINVSPGPLPKQTTPQPGSTPSTGQIDTYLQSYASKMKPLCTKVQEDWSVPSVTTINPDSRIEKVGDGYSIKLPEKRS